MAYLGSELFGGLSKSFGWVRGVGQALERDAGQVLSRTEYAAGAAAVRREAATIGETAIPSVSDLLGRQGTIVERLSRRIDTPVQTIKRNILREPNLIDPLVPVTGGGRLPAGQLPPPAAHPGYQPMTPRTGKKVMREPNLIDPQGNIMPEMRNPPPTATEQMVETAAGNAVASNKPFPTGLVAGGVLAGLGIYSLFDRDEYSMESNRPVF